MTWSFCNGEDYRERNVIGLEGADAGSSAKAGKKATLYPRIKKLSNEMVIFLQKGAFNRGYTRRRFTSQKTLRKGKRRGSRTAAGERVGNEKSTPGERGSGAGG